jgi:HK97 family phage prohead protease
MNGDTFAAPVELKLASDETGEFEGYGAVYGNVDGQGDRIEPGAFREALAEHKSKGTMPALYFEHGPWMGGDKRPIGVWKSVEEDSHGLLCKGKISGLNTERGRTFYELMKDGAIKGLSIAFAPKANGVVYGTHPRRILKNLALRAIDLVTTPANALAQIASVKALGGLVDPERAAIALAEQMALIEETLSGGNAPTAEHRAKLRSLAQDAHEALTGYRAPPGLKSKPNTIREFETALRESGFSNAEARTIAESGFKTLSPRDEDDAKAVATEDLKAAQSAIDALLKKL